MEFDSEAMTLVACGTTVPMMSINNTVWFKGNDCAAILMYKDPKRAVKRHVDPEWQETLRELLGKGGTDRTPPQNNTSNNLNAEWISEAGLYDLASSSKLPTAIAFKKWVFGVVLPSIRKTGSYSLQQGTPAATENIGWQNKRLEGKELMRLKDASLQQLISGGFGQTGPKLQLYAIAANLINQAVLQVGFQQTTKQEAATAARAHRHSRHAQHAGAGGDVLCRGVLPKVHHRQSTALEAVGRSRAAHKVQGSETQLKTRVCVYRHG